MRVVKWNMAQPPYNRMQPGPRPAISHQDDEVQTPAHMKRVSFMLSFNILATHL